MFGLGLTEFLIILAIGLLVFGTTRLKKVGAGMKFAAKGFRDALTDDEASPRSVSAEATPDQVDTRHNT